MLCKTNEKNKTTIEQIKRSQIVKKKHLFLEDKASPFVFITTQVSLQPVRQLVCKQTNWGLESSSEPQNVTSSQESVQRKSWKEKKMGSKNYATDVDRS